MSQAIMNWMDQEENVVSLFPLQQLPVLATHCQEKQMARYIEEEKPTNIKSTY